MTISIVVPFYNEEGIIGIHLEHILNQTSAPDEVILVDNGSVDSSVTIADSFRDRFEQQKISFKIMQVLERPQEYARIRGFREAEGELIGMIDVDTSISKDWVRVAKDSFVDNSELVAIGGPFYFSNIPAWTKIQWFLIFLLYLIGPKYFFLIWGCNCVFRKSAYERIGGLEGYLAMRDGLELKYVYDDAYLSEMFKRFGRVKFVSGLKASGTARYGKGRTWDQFKSFFKIKKWVGKIQSQ